MDFADTLIAILDADGDIRVYVPGTSFFMVPKTGLEEEGWKVYRVTDSLNDIYKSERRFDAVEDALNYIEQRQAEEEREKVKRWNRTPIQG